MSIFFKKVPKVDNKEWFDVFMKKSHTVYHLYTSGSSSYDSWEHIKTTMICVCLEGVVHYECKFLDDNGKTKIEYISEKDLKFPTKDCHE